MMPNTRADQWGVAPEALYQKLDLTAWKRRYCFNEGWRTPSSFGSPALTAANTAASTPKGSEVGRVDSGTWDEHCSDERSTEAGADDISPTDKTGADDSSPQDAMAATAA
jgi:hypothetical protein